ncbi:MAG: hypothetical protein ABSH28_09070 [Acidobacteriota bacterium]|jgi:hypothetical protein
MVRKRNSPSLRRLERRLDSRDAELQEILGHVLTGFKLLTDSIGNMQTTLKTRLPIWGEPEAEPAKVPKPS